MRHTIQKGLETLVGVSSFLFGACNGARFYGYCSGEGPPYEIPTDNFGLALSISVGTLGTALVVSYGLQILKEHFRRI